MSAPWYATREDVKSALDVKETARDNAQVDRAIESASRAVESLLHRRFYPDAGTRYFDWPNGSYARSWRLWLDDNELISIDSLASGGVTMDPASYFLRRSDNRDEPPYNSIELSLDTDAAFGQGSTWQRDIAVTGVFGYRDDTAPAGELASSVNGSAMEIAVTDSSSIGVGDLLLIEDERVSVTSRLMADTGQQAGTLDAKSNAVTVTVDDGSGFSPGEVLLIDSERMLVVDVAGDNLTVKRAWDGSVLAAHEDGASVWAARTLVVSRGVLGTTAGPHSSGVAVSRTEYPGPVRALYVAEAICTLLNETAGYARTAGQGDNAREAAGRALADARTAAIRSCGRRARTRAV